MPATRPGPEDRSRRQKQEDAGAQSDQGGRPAKTNEPKPEPTVFEGGEETQQQRRAE